MNFHHRRVCGNIKLSIHKVSSVTKPGHNKRSTPSIIACRNKVARFQKKRVWVKALTDNGARYLLMRRSKSYLPNLLGRNK